MSRKPFGISAKDKSDFGSKYLNICECRSIDSSFSTIRLKPWSLAVVMAMNEQGKVPFTRYKTLFFRSIVAPLLLFYMEVKVFGLWPKNEGGSKGISAWPIGHMRECLFDFSLDTGRKGGLDV